MNMHSPQHIQDLPQDILYYIYDFIQADWLKLCSKKFWHLYMDNDHRCQLCRWYRLQKQKIQLQHDITKNKQKLLDLERCARYRTFRDFDTHNFKKQSIVDDIGWIRGNINTIYKRQQEIYGCGASYKYMIIRFREIIGRSGY